MYVAEREIGADEPIREHYLVGEFDTDDQHNYVTRRSPRRMLPI
jgi:hypothetical protein